MNTGTKKRIIYTVISLLLCVCLTALAGCGAKTDDGSFAGVPGGTDTGGSAGEENSVNIVFDTTVVSTSDGGLAFASDTEDFITCYNALYPDNDNKLPKASEWLDEGMWERAHFGCEVSWRRCRADEESWTSPAFSAYTDADGRLRELTVDFDDHGMSAGMFLTFKQMAISAMSLFIPEVHARNYAPLLSRMYAETDELISETGFDDCEAPPVLYRSGNVGVYPYFSYGEFIRICFVPLTPGRITELSEAGTQVIEIETLELPEPEDRPEPHTLCGNYALLP